MSPLSSPLPKFPPEIIGQIFIAYHESIGYTSPLSALRDISLTCRDWRDIAYSTPELWSTIDLCLPNNVPIALLDNLHTLLSRSRDHPLSVQLKIYRHSPSSSADGASKLMNMLLEHVHRWRTVRLELRCSIFPYFDGAYYNRKAHILENVQINSLRSLIIPRDLIVMLASSPQLRTWADIGTPAYIEGLDYFNGLVNLQMTLPNPPSKLFEILNSLSSLEYLNVLLDKEIRPPGAVVPVLTMLKTLKLSLTAYSSLDLFFSGIHIPNLDGLEIHFREFSSFGSHMKVIENFLRAINGQITSFAIRNMCIPEEDLLECLSILSPNLQRLGILADSTLSAVDYYVIENVTERTIEALTLNTEQEPLCPRLDHLILERCIAAVDGGLSEMVRSRWRTRQSESDQVSCLRYLRVIFRYHTHHDDASNLRQLQSEGLDCQVGYGSTRLSDDGLH